MTTGAHLLMSPIKEMQVLLNWIPAFAGTKDSSKISIKATHSVKTESR